jgi:sugar O-acyltransferase (sialic acid O-acetyltransferase NeuD family)
MIIAGAKGHASEVIQVLEAVLDEKGLDELFFFDDVSDGDEARLFGRYPVVRSLPGLGPALAADPRFILATGSPASRYALSARLRAAGGQLTSLVAPTVLTGNHGVRLGPGLNLMHYVLITNEVTIGEGTLVNAGAAVHHDVRVGRYNEIGPGARLLGNCRTGDFCRVGASATLLPHVTIGQHVEIGAGAVVTRDVEDHAVAVGVPARILKKRPQPTWL